MGIVSERLRQGRLEAYLLTGRYRLSQLVRGVAAHPGQPAVPVDADREARDATESRLVTERPPVAVPAERTPRLPPHPGADRQAPGRRRPVPPRSIPPSRRPRRRSPVGRGGPVDVRWAGEVRLDPPGECRHRLGVAGVEYVGAGCTGATCRVVVDDPFLAGDEPLTQPTHRDERRPCPRSPLTGCTVDATPAGLAAIIRWTSTAMPARPGCGPGWPCHRGWPDGRCDAVDPAT
jgi:hypothetical protein